jgi:hypothetical protein
LTGNAHYLSTGAIGNLASAVSVAASSFDMKVTNPKSFLDEIDLERVSKLLGHRSKIKPRKFPNYVEPSGDKDSKHSDDVLPSTLEANLASTATPVTPSQTNSISKQSLTSSDILHGKVQILGDFIDTDAVSVSWPPFSQYL